MVTAGEMNQLSDKLSNINYTNSFLEQGSFVMMVIPSKESENAIPVTGKIEFFKDSFGELDLKITFANSFSTTISMDFCMDGNQKMLSIFYKNQPKEETSTYKTHYGHLLIMLPDDPSLKGDFPFTGSYTNHDRDTKGNVHIYKKESDIPRIGKA